MIEIPEPLDWMKAVEFASRIKHVVEEPIAGIAGPLEAHIGIAFGRGSLTWAQAVMAGDRAAALDVWLLVDDGAGNALIRGNRGGGQRSPSRPKRTCYPITRGSLRPH